MCENLWIPNVLSKMIYKLYTGDKHKYTSTFPVFHLVDLPKTSVKYVANCIHQANVSSDFFF